MVPHYSGTTLDAQARYAAGTKSILENYLTGKAQEPQNVIVGRSECFLSQKRLFTYLFISQRGTRLKLVST